MAMTFFFFVIAIDDKYTNHRGTVYASPFLAIPCHFPRRGSRSWEVARGDPAATLTRTAVFSQSGGAVQWDGVCSTQHERCREDIRGVKREDADPGSWVGIPP